MTEILVAIGIIVILVAITLPVVSKVRVAAQRASSQQQIRSLEAAIERYQADFRAYPGPLSNDEIAQTDPNLIPKLFLEDGTTPFPGAEKITMAENLVLGLLGGLRRLAPTGANSSTPGVLVYDFTAVGKGPGQLDPKQPKKFSPYAEPIELSWNDNQPSTGEIIDPVTKKPLGYYIDDASLSRRADPHDSRIPEFVDRFTNPMPILYLRARTAAPGIISDVSGLGSLPYQYDLNQIEGYTEPTGAGETIGVGKDISPGDYMIGFTKTPPPANRLPHGLTRPVEQDRTMQKGTLKYKYPFDPVPYFQDPTIRPLDGNNPNPTGTPRKKNGYILISAGADRVYGTYDDITSFGDVAP